MNILIILILYFCKVMLIKGYNQFENGQKDYDITSAFATMNNWLFSILNSQGKSCQQTLALFRYRLDRNDNDELSFDEVHSFLAENMEQFESSSSNALKLIINNYDYRRDNFRNVILSKEEWLSNPEHPCYPFSSIEVMFGDQTDEKIEKLKRSHLEMDAEGDFKVNWNELVDYVANVNKTMAVSLENVKFYRIMFEAHKKSDRNGLTRDELIKFTSTFKDDKLTMTTFKLIDENADDWITKEELAKFISQFYTSTHINDDFLNSELLKGYMQELDQNNDKRISFNEWKVGEERKKSIYKILI